MKRKNDDDIVYSDSEDDFSGASDNEIASLTGLKRKKVSKSTTVEHDEEKDETIDEKRIRLARNYLDSVGMNIDQEEESEVDDDDEYGDDAVGRELRKQALRVAGKEARRTITDKMNLGFLGRDESQNNNIPYIDSSDIRIMRGHRLPATCLALCEEDKFVMSGSKDGSICQFDIETGKKSLFSKQAHSNGVLGLALSSDSVYLASCGEDSKVRVWDVRAGTVAREFSNHMDVVSCVSFRKDSLTLFSGSYDRTIKIFDCEQFNYLETLYGHQSAVTSIDALYPEKCYSVGTDSTLRIWKIETESQLLLKAPSDHLSIDTISAFTMDHFVTGSQNGSFSLWHSGKKRPVHTIPNAHGNTWISSTAALYASDFCASGGADGHVRFWQASIHTNLLKPLFTAPVVGHVNGLQFGQKGKFAVAAVGQEHKFGRWSRINKARNGVHLIDLSKVTNDDYVLSEDEDQDDEDEDQESY